MDTGEARCVSEGIAHRASSCVSDAQSSWRVLHATGVRYADYINSAEWRAFKIKYYATHDKKCQACESEDSIHLHHHTYERLGHEHSDDVLPLCATCHALVHEYHRQKERDLTIATFTIVRQIAAASKGTVLAVLNAGRASSPAAGFVPRHLRGSKTDSQGRQRSVLTWREEVRPWWTQPPHPIERVNGR